MSKREQSKGMMNKNIYKMYDFTVQMICIYVNKNFEIV